jgi:Tol biopolymer transport system component
MHTCCAFLIFNNIIKRLGEVMSKENWIEPMYDTTHPEYLINRASANDPGGGFSSEVRQLIQAFYLEELLNGDHHGNITTEQAVVLSILSMLIFFGLGVGITSKAEADSRSYNTREDSYGLYHQEKVARTCPKGGLSISRVPGADYYPLFHTMVISMGITGAADLINQPPLLSPTTAVTERTSLNKKAPDEDPAWSPDGSRIAFTSYRDGKGDIYIMDPDGSNVLRLTYNPARDSDPAWSPDGSRIAFTSNRDGNPEIYIKHIKLDYEIRLTTNPADDWAPAWSPDGSRIAFTSNRDGNLEIYVINLRSREIRRLTFNKRTDMDPAWSPDGSRIAFTSYRDDNFDICIMDSNGRNVRRITDNKRDEYSPAWTPDGDKIVFSRDMGGGSNPVNLDIYITNVDRGEAEALLKEPPCDHSSSVSPDGNFIVFESVRDGTHKICIVNIDGGNLRCLT